MRMVRKQLYLGDAQAQKLRRLATRWRCPEAEVVRRAIERLPEGDDATERLRAAGLLVEADDVDLPKDRAAEELQRWFERWTRTRKAPLALSQAVLEDRR